MNIYIVSLKTKKVYGTIYDGVWGAFSSLEKAREAIEEWIIQYEEQEIEYYTPDNGLKIYITNKSKWIIEPILLDSK